MRSLRSEGLPRARGFTLLELAVVLALLGAILLTVIPRLSIFEESAFRSDARRVASLIRQLDDSAAAEKSNYKLSFDIGGNRLEASKTDGGPYVPPERMPAFVRLGRTTAITELMENNGAKKTGEAQVIFQPTGAEPFSISLASGGRTCTITYNPYSGKVKII
ncbi:MAG: prepilin-type N-terminal cleavage/methylation domain-containing protein [Deltaproteobacteria bacterium]|nr:prepilin-type N-terminal cleavage/methylation domain-containing protein [Deltaproteobacteria bacterium]